MAAMQGTLRVLLLGKTGSGKSSLGNLLLGDTKFQIRRGMSSGTDKCGWADANPRDFNLQVTDTPGLCDTHRSEESIIIELAKSIATCAPGPHIVLMVCRCDRRFDRAEFDAYVALKKLFGNEICEKMIVIFAGVDALEESLENQQEAVKMELAANPSQISTVLNDANQRYYAVSNSPTTPDLHKASHAQKIFDMMWDLYGKNTGKYYTSRMCEEMERQVEALVPQRMRRDDVTREEAQRRIRLGIVEETLGPEFVHVTLDLVEKGLPADHAVHLATLCKQQ